jgi:glycosyltransferase involved in cell wall biosynthesis
MIVKNEARVIRRCLDSVRPFIHHWVVVDTGSSDGTQELIRTHFADLPGELHERPWKNFGHNRSEALALARGKADYILVIDADEELIAERGFTMPPLTAEEYLVLYRLSESPVTWYRATLIRASLPWRYQGILHEHLECGHPPSSDKLTGLSIRSYSDGARNVDPIKKYANDALILEQGLRDEPDNTRYVFYLAQSYRDSEQTEKAIETYERRVALGGWPEEVWYSLFQVAVLKHKLRRTWSEVLAAYLFAYQYRPARAEPLCALAMRYRETKEWALAELFARAASAVRRPDDILFVDDSVYDWRALDELAVAAYYTGKLQESASLNRRLLSDGKLPASERARVEENLAFCVRQVEPSARKRKNEQKRRRRGRA